jgi:hypothetical protein
LPEKYVPKHRDVPPKHRAEPPQRFRSGAKKAVVIPGIAVLATGLAVGVGVAASNGSANGSLVHLAAGKTLTGAAAQDLLASRQEAVSRSSDDRVSTAASPLKTAELSTASGVAVTRSVDLTNADPQALTRALMPEYGMASSDFECINEIWTQESNWNVHANNPSSSAYGIPQALPGSKMSSAGPDWQNNAETQIRWGLSYIEKRYGSPCAAWSFKRAHGWY